MIRHYRHSPQYSTNVRVNSILRITLQKALTLICHLSPALAHYIIRKLFFSPARHKLSPHEKALLQKADNFVITVHGKKIQCWQWGQGPAVLFAHGWNGRGVQFRLFFNSLQAAGFSIIVLDAPGHGMSDGTTSSYFEYSDILRAVLKSKQVLNLEAVIGHSFGASASINALSKENIAAKLILLAPALKLKELLWSTFDRYGIPEYIYRAIIEDYEKRYGYSIDEDNPHRLLNAVNTEVLIIHDTEDQATPYKYSELAASDHDHIILHTTSGLGHKKLLADKHVISTVIDFLKQKDKPQMTQVNMNKKAQPVVMEQKRLH